MKNHHIKHLIGAIALACSALAGTAQAEDINSIAKGASPNGLIYSYDEMFQFDIEAFLMARAPHLLPHAEAISH